MCILKDYFFLSSSTRSRSLIRSALRSLQPLCIFVCLSLTLSVNAGAALRNGCFCSLVDLPFALCCRAGLDGALHTVPNGNGERLRSKTLAPPPHTQHSTAAEAAARFSSFPPTSLISWWCDEDESLLAHTIWCRRAAAVLPL